MLVFDHSYWFLTRRVAPNEHFDNESFEFILAVYYWPILKFF
jgi:hypothetical protein